MARSKECGVAREGSGTTRKIDVLDMHAPPSRVINAK